MTARPILYSFRRCPYAMRARMALIASRTLCELREVKLSNKPAEMLEASPKGTVPVLVTAEGTVIDQSLDIMRWALGRNDPEGWLAGDDADLIATNDGPFKHHLDRYKYPNRHDSHSDEHRAAGLAMVAALEPRLTRTANIHGEAASLTDVAIMPFVRQFAEVDRAWFDSQPLPQLQSWLTRHIGSALFAAAMIRVPTWEAGQAPLLLVSN